MSALQVIKHFSELLKPTPIAFSITLKNNRTGAYLALPVLPIEGKLTYNYGETQATSADIIDLGPVETPSGDDLDAVTLTSFFPARYDQSLCTTSKLKKPLEYEAIILEWKKAKDSIQFIVPAAKINKAMYIQNYVPDYGRGSEGDIFYSLDLREYRKVKPLKIKQGTTVVNRKPTPAKRPPAAKKPAPKTKTYTVKRGDTLIKIAKAHKIKDWRKNLYLPNKKPKGPLGNDPDQIMPGMKLKLP